MKSLWLFAAAVAACVAGAALWWANHAAPANPVGPPPAEGPTGPPWFRDVTDEVGLKFVHDAGSVGNYFMPEIVGSGVALFDFNNDGLMDLYLIQNGGPNSPSKNRLFRQNKDKTFTDVSAGSGLDVSGHGMGVAVGDVNNDGWADVFVTEYGRVRLLLNNRDGTFTDISKEAGLDNPLWATSAAFFDYDRDGWLDLVIVNYLEYDPNKPCDDKGGKQDYCGPKSFTPAVTRLYRNLGRGSAGAKGVRFEDVTAKSGLGLVRGPGLGVAIADFSGDHWPDILVANDGAPNHLWINQRNGTFKEEGVVRGLAYDGVGRAQANMGIAVGDLDGNGLLDVFITHLPEELHICWTQGPAGQFLDKTTALGLANPKWRSTGFGTVFGDFDHDGALDLAWVNGGVKRPASTARGAYGSATFWDQFAERNQLLANDGAGHFRDVSLDNPDLCGSRAVCRGLAVGDLDGDGALDLVVTRTANSARVYRNVAPQRGHWLLVRAIDPALGGRDAYGAEVTLEAGGRRWLRNLHPAYSYLCSNDPRGHFGLGKADRVDALHVVWPDGKEEDFPGAPADRQVVLRKGEGKAPKKP